MENTALDTSNLRIIDPYATETAEGPKDLGQDEFLRLLLTKLKAQDPLDPARDTEFIAQLAQFSSLEQLIHVNEGLSRVEQGQANLVNAQALELIGRSVLVDSGGNLRLRDGVADEVVYAMPEQAAGGVMEIVAEDGRTVREVELENLSPGRWRVRWDGQGDFDGDGDADGLMADGDYSFRIRAWLGDGEAVPTESFITVRVDGVNFAHGGLTLVSGDREIPFFNIVEIRADDGASSES